MIDFKEIKSVYFIGIGGIGISAIARMMLLEGKKVAGSDRSASIITDELKKVPDAKAEAGGAKIFIGHDAKNIPKDCDLVIYTIAIPESNPELVEARKRKIPMLTYPEALGIISKDKFTIAVSGTHGKTTTTAMIGKMMIDAGLDPTVIVGSLMNDTKSNFVVGKSKYFVVESCEYHRSFLNISPKIIVITNIDNDHLDYYKDLVDIQSAFSEFVSKLGVDDFLITNSKDKNIGPVVKYAESGCRIVDYSKLGHSVSKLKLKVFGKHNIENAKAALALAEVLGIDENIAITSLNNFSGTWRRFEYKGKTQHGANVYDDYGHHPTEIRATLSGVRDHFGDKRIVVIFQPHLYSRTKLLLNDFAKSFNEADELILLPIYAAREKEDKTISSEFLASKIVDRATVRGLASHSGIAKDRLRQVTVVKTKEEAAALAGSIAADVIITIGAGDVTELSDLLTKI